VTVPTSSPRVAALILFLLLTVVARGHAADLEDPYDIMHRHYQAVGGLERLKTIATSRSEGRVHYDGLKGTFKHWEQRPLQRRTEEDYGIISHIEGDSGQASWFFDTNDQLLIIRDEDTLKRRRIALLLDRYEHLERNSPHFSLTFAGVATVRDRPCYEVILDNTINSDRSHFFFDTDTLLMVHSRHKQPDMEVESYYDDFREVDGIMVAFHLHSTFHPWEKTEEVWTESYAANPQVDPQLFQPPPRQKGFRIDDGATRATVPFQLIENLIYLEVAIGDDRRTWVLDSGASMSVIDHDYAEGLQLTAEGSIKGYGFGELFELSFVKIPEYRVGAIHFDGQKLYVSKGLAAKSYEPYMVGILGYDFLSRFVVELDYDLGLATFHDPEAFHYRGTSTPIDAPLKYRTFALPVTVDDRYTSHWTIDLGSYHSSIHYPFAEKHALLERPGVDIVSQGMTSLSLERNILFDCLQVGDFRLDRPIIALPLEKGVGATALGEVGGNLGNSTLNHFRLFLDYPRQQVIFEQGATFNDETPHDRSGLIIGRGDNNQPILSLVATGSPGAKAGLLAGDFLVEFAGESIGPEHPIVPLREKLRGPAGSTVELKVRRGDELLSATLTLEELFPQSAGCAAPSS
jgi:hypothetical protein